ncbi:cuticle protein AM1199-like [Palaemon carinicauda]|uniref:cuticle protein AM1199-like n=1 Tax=Palaemon carinicauda TaxID=392227 RepID=UPI0035B5D458
MQFVVVFSFLLSVAAALPEPEAKAQFGNRPTYRPRPYSYWPHDHLARTVYDFRRNDHNGAFNYEFQTENGIRVAASGRPGIRGQSNVVGSYSYPHPEGGVAQVDYVADEFGYRATSPLIPPIPAHSLQQIHKAEYERARGIRWY